jgi:hypothetical protein
MYRHSIIDMSSRNVMEKPVEPPALVFYKTKINFYNVIQYGLMSSLFTVDEALASNRIAVVEKVRAYLQEKLKSFVLQGDYESAVELTGEELNEETIVKYKLLVHKN